VTPETDVAIVGMMERKSCEEVYVAIGVFPRKK
jgi:hypothetical protein